MANRKLSRGELIKVHELLKQHLTIVTDGVVEYKEGWSDAKIAKEIHPDIQPPSVGNARLELFGRFQRQTPVNDSKERIVNLEQIVTNLAKLLDEQKNKYNKLIDNLAVNRVVDVKHLKL